MDEASRRSLPGGGDGCGDSGHAAPNNGNVIRAFLSTRSAIKRVHKGCLSSRTLVTEIEVDHSDERIVSDVPSDVLT